MTTPGNTPSAEYDDDDDDDHPAGLDDDRGADDGLLRDRCVLGDRCIAADPFHRSDECWTAEDAEAYFAEVDSPPS